MSMLLSQIKSYDVRTNKNESNTATSETGRSGNIQEAKEALIKGQVLKGEIIDLRSDEVVIQMTDGSTVHGTMEGEVELYIGQQASFEVTQESEKQIILKLLSEETANPEDTFVQKALEQAGLPGTQRNKAVVLALLDQNLSIDKQSINHIIKQMYQFPKASASDLVFLKKNGLTVSKENLEGAQQYRNSEHRVLAELSNIAGELGELLSDEEGVAKDTVTKLLQLAIGSTDEASEGTDAVNVKSTGTDGAKGLESGDVQIQGKDVVRSVETGTIPSDIQGELLETADDTQSTLSELLPIESRQELAQELSQLGVNDQQIGKMLDGSMTGKQLVQILLDLTTSKGQDETGELTQKDLVGQENNQSLQKLLRSDSVRIVYEDTLMKNYTLHPEKLKEEKSIAKVYDKMERDMDKLNQILQETNTRESSGKTMAQAEHVKSNIEFMKTLNEIAPYVQLPVYLKDKNLHSELYVFTRKKGKLSSEDSLRVLLHLDMDHLGPLDISLQMDRKRIQAKFYVQDDDIKQLVLETSQELSQTLEQSGYVLSVDCQKQTKQKSPIEQIQSEAVGSESLGMKRYTFDIRA